MRGQCGSWGHLEVKCHPCLTAATIVIHRWIYASEPTSLGLDPGGGKRRWAETDTTSHEESTPYDDAHLTIAITVVCRRLIIPGNGWEIKLDDDGGYSNIISRGEGEVWNEAISSFKREIAIPGPLCGCLRGLMRCHFWKSHHRRALTPRAPNGPRTRRGVRGPGHQRQDSGTFGWEDSWRQTREQRERRWENGILWNMRTAKGTDME